jgi:hypothetical protein
MALHLLSSEQLRTHTRQRLESLELWLRRLIHDEFVASYGSNYVEAAAISGQAIFNADTRKHVASRIATASAPIARPVDTLLLDHLATILCKEDVYRTHFKRPLSHSFPQGQQYLRLMLQRLVPIRNALSHANPISTHEAERALCYSSDVIASLVKHYAAIGMSQDFDAPLFTRYVDSLGNAEVPSKAEVQLNFTMKQALRCGDSLRIELEVDTHYAPDTYDISWLVTGVSQPESGTGHSFALTLLPKHVNEYFCIFATLIARNREWHRNGQYDARLVLVYRVLPPA